MVKDGRRQTSTVPSMVGSSVASTTEEDFKNLTSIHEYQKKEPTTTTPYNYATPKYHGGYIYETISHPSNVPTTSGVAGNVSVLPSSGRIEEKLPREDKSGLVEDREDHYPDKVQTYHPHPKVTHNSPGIPPRHADNHLHPTYNREPVISFWPVGILVLAVFIVGFISMFLCRAVTPRHRDTRRAVLTLPRASQRSSRSQRGTTHPVAECHILNDDDEGGFNDASRRHIVIPGVRRSDPPRVVTPPPPYPGSPPGGSVYVNPLDVKPEDASGSHNTYSSSAAVNCNEPPPPYPGTEP